jgi:tRNA (cmo5U34)-methyltransferase
MVARDETMPSGPWVFDAEVTAALDDMLQRTVPQYDSMRQACFDLACLYRQPETDIVDLGCSRGAAMAPLVERHGATNHFVGVDVSEPMVEAARARFASYIDAGVVDIRLCDLRRGYPPVRASVTLAILTVQWVPVEHRQQLLAAAREHTVPGGALILVEKVLGATAAMDDVLVHLHHAMKAANGYTQESIETKRRSLEGVLVPVTAARNEDMLRAAGFDDVECVWRWMNFAAWIAVRR